jgi:hypothetical protein
MTETRTPETYRLTFHVPTDYDDDGEPTGWQIHTVETAKLVARDSERLTFRQRRDDNGELYDWDAYSYDFGPQLGVRWAYGTSAELLTVELVPGVYFNVRSQRPGEDATIAPKLSHATAIELAAYLIEHGYEPSQVEIIEATDDELEGGVDVDTLNRAFVAVITREGITQPEYDEATVLYRAEDVEGLRNMISEAAVRTY